MRISPSLLLLCLIMWSNINAQTEPIDFIRQLQFEAAETKTASWGRWGSHPTKYSSWTNHSNRLIPIYTFGMSLDQFTGENSCYRSKETLTEIFGVLPDETVNSKATYMDQTEVFQLQKNAVGAGKKNIILIVFDGMDWPTTQAAAIYKKKSVTYDSRYGNGLAFLDYDGCEKDTGDFVCSPHNTGTKTDVDSQTVSNIGGNKHGGYSAEHGGYHSWSKPNSESYLLGKQKNLVHVVTDSAASATSLNSGAKTYNSSINVDPEGKQLVPLARVLQNKGFKIGVVSSVPISHATPACTYANNVSRNDYQDLTRDLVGLPSTAHRKPLPGVDVLIGCGWGETKQDDRKKQGKNFVPGNKFIAEDDLNKINIENDGKYVVAERTRDKDGGKILATAANFAASRNARLFGFFGHAGGHLPYQTADGNYDPTRGQQRADRYTQDEITENPTLAEMTEAALTVLGKNEKGFWLMIESGDVDWANHNNNIDDSIGAVFSGEAAFEAVTAWIEENSNWEESAVIVTADHGHFFVLTDPVALTGRNREKELEVDNAVDNNKCP